MRSAESISNIPACIGRENRCLDYRRGSGPSQLKTRKTPQWRGLGAARRASAVASVGRYPIPSNSSDFPQFLGFAELLTKEALKEALENLSYRERRVLELRYGLGGEHPRSLDEVGRTFNVTRERIRQIENQSLKKLQSLAEAQKLREVA